MCAAISTLQPLRTTLLGLFVWSVACREQQLGSKREASPVERGRYLVQVGGCNDCHTPKVLSPSGPVPDTTRLLSGHPAGVALPPVPRGLIGPDRWGALTTGDLTAWVGPWGVSYASNLTPDATGLGVWRAEHFIQTMRSGKHRGVGRPILPPMPWVNYGKMTDEDLRAVFAYLQSLRPIVNVVPAPQSAAGREAAR